MVTATNGEQTMQFTFGWNNGGFVTTEDPDFKEHLVDLCKQFGKPDFFRPSESFTRDEMEVKSLIIETMARAYFVCEYADEMEGREDDHSYLVAGAGDDWMEVAPETPEDYIPYASKVYDQITPDPAKCLLAMNLSECERNADDFGHYLAMEMMGHGVSWDDGMFTPHHGLELPHTGSSDLLPCEYFRPEPQDD
jgi:hypothetical protein